MYDFNLARAHGNKVIDNHVPETKNYGHTVYLQYICNLGGVLYYRGRSTADSGVAEVQITRRHRVSTSTTFAVPDSSFRLLSLVDSPPFPSLL